MIFHLVSGNYQTKGIIKWLLPHPSHSMITIQFLLDIFENILLCVVLKTVQKKYNLHLDFGSLNLCIGKTNYGNKWL